MPFNAVAMQCFLFRVSTQKLASLSLCLIEESPFVEDRTGIMTAPYCGFGPATSSPSRPSIGSSGAVAAKRSSSLTAFSANHPSCNDPSH